MNVKPPAPDYETAFWVVAMVKMFVLLCIILLIFGWWGVSLFTLAVYILTAR